MELGTLEPLNLNFELETPTCVTAGSDVLHTCTCPLLKTPTATLLHPTAIQDGGAMPGLPAFKGPSKMSWILIPQSRHCLPDINLRTWPSASQTNMAPRSPTATPKNGGFQDGRNGWKCKVHSPWYPSVHQEQQRRVRWGGQIQLSVLRFRHPSVSAPIWHHHATEDQTR